MRPSRDKYAQRLRMLLSEAQVEARALGHLSIGTEHLLLALLAQGGSVACAVLDELRCNRDDMRARVLSIIGRRGPPSPETTELPLTSRAHGALAAAENIADVRGNSYVGPEHLLLGMVHAHEGIGGQLLREAGVTPDLADATLRTLLGDEAPPASRQ